MQKNIAAWDPCLAAAFDGDVSVGINCGACGYATCAALEKVYTKKETFHYDIPAPTARYRMADLGIAVG